MAIVKPESKKRRRYLYSLCFSFTFYLTTVVDKLLGGMTNCILDVDIIKININILIFLKIEKVEDEQVKIKHHIS